MSMQTKSRKDKKKALRSLVALLLCLLTIIPLLTSALLTIASAKSSGEIQKELAALKNQAQEIANQGKALEKELAGNADQTKTTIEEKSAIDRRISITEAEIRNVNQQLQQYSLLVAEKQKELEAAQSELDEMNAAYKLRLRAMEENGSVSYWSILFKSRSFSDLLDRIDMIRETAEADQRMLKEMEAAAASIEQDRLELEQEQADQQAAKQSLNELEETLMSQRAEADTLLLQLAEEEDKLSAAFDANEEAEAELRAQIMAAQAEYEKALSKEEAERLAQLNANNAASGNKPSGSVTPSTSGFVNPLGSITVTCAYGWRIHPIWGDKRFHYGVDLAANSGAPIYAIASGTVTTAAYGDANGYYVALSHGNGYGSVYCHMTNYVVKVGDKVSQGQVIGYVGSTGWSTGPHLHFEIHLNGSSVNPMDYIG